MTYQPRPNASGDTLSASRDQIRTNFINIEDVFAINHVDFDETGEGKHTFLQMPDQDPAPTTAANEGGFYVKDATGSNLFFRSESDGEEYQISTVSDGDIATFGTNTAYSANHTGGWSFLPGGLILQYGIRSSLSQGNNVVTFSRTFPTAVFNVVITPVRNSSNVDIIYIRSAATITTSQFEMRNTASGITIGHWYAIGN